MGIDISSKLIVGLHFDDMAEWLEERMDEEGLDSIQDAIHDYFEYASPYYDSSCEEWIIGFQITTGSGYSTEEVVAEIQKESDRFEKLVGKKPYVFDTPNVY